MFFHKGSVTSLATIIREEPGRNAWASSLSRTMTKLASFASEGISNTSRWRSLAKGNLDKRNRQDGEKSWLTGNIFVFVDKRLKGGSRSEREKQSKNGRRGAAKRQSEGRKKRESEGNEITRGWRGQEDSLEVTQLSKSFNLETKPFNERHGFILAI